MSPPHRFFAMAVAVAFLYVPAFAGVQHPNLAQARWARRAKMEQKNR